MGNLLSTSYDLDSEHESDIAAYAVKSEPLQVPTKPTKVVRKPINIQRRFQNPFSDTTVYSRKIEPADAVFKFFEPTFVRNGQYECVNVQKGSVVYHGGGAMKANVELPIGTAYYSPDEPVLTKSARDFLANDIMPGEEREKFLNDILDKNVTYAYFGPLETAKGYSVRADAMCGVNCLGSFVFKRDILALDISNEYNIYKLLYAPDSVLGVDPDARTFFGAAYGIEDTSMAAIPKYWDLSTPDSPKLINYVRYSLRNDPNFDGPIIEGRNQYFILPILLIIAKMNGCDALYNGLFYNPSLPELKRGPELIIGNAHDVLDRNYEDPVDWQTRVHIEEILSQPNLNQIYKTMLQYKTLNIDFHAGDLYAHSIWVALYTQKRLLSVYGNTGQDKWAAQLVSAVFDLGSPAPDKDYELICKFAVIGAFLHDIGKIGGGYIYYDKKEHPRIGMEYLSNHAQMSLANGKKLNPDELFEELSQKGDIDARFRQLFMIFIWGIVLFHWDFGYHLSLTKNGIPYETSAGNYIKKIWKWWSETIQANGVGEYQKMFSIFIIVLIIVSICDVQGSQVFHNSNIGINQRLVVGIKGLPNAPKQHKGGKKFEDFDIENSGFSLFKEIIRQLGNKKRHYESDDSTSKRIR